MYQKNDLIVYGTSGVCRVAEVGPAAYSGAAPDRTYYTLKPLFQGGTIYTPVDNTRVPMRTVICREEAQGLIDTIPQAQAEPFHTRNTRELAEHYEQALRTHDCAQWLNLAMSIYAKKQAAQDSGHRLGQVDEKFMKQAEELLYGELSVALDIPKESVPGYIARQVNPGEGDSSD